MPTDEQLREYAAKLPEIYRHVLGAFPGAVPDRKAGYGLMVGSVIDYLDDAEPGYDPGDIQDALDQLARSGFYTRHPELGSYAPTDLGERLITAVTGHIPRAKGAPPLPQPTWG